MTMRNNLRNLKVLYFLNILLTINQESFLRKPVTVLVELWTLGTNQCFYRITNYWKGGMVKRLVLLH